MAIEVTVRKWGNSMGVVFPKEFVASKNIKQNDKILVEVVKEADFSKIFGIGKNIKKSGQELKDEMRRGWKD